MVNGPRCFRFAANPASAAANRGRTSQRAKMSLPPGESVSLFNRYLSDLYCPFAKRIGALGQAPTFPDDSEAELQEVCVTLRRCVKEWRGYGDGFE